MVLTTPPQARGSGVSFVDADALTPESKQVVPEPAGAVSAMHVPSGAHCASRSRRQAGNSSTADTPAPPPLPVAAPPPVPPVPASPRLPSEQASDSKPRTPMLMYLAVRIEVLPHVAGS